jgi:hypothetical protein
MFAGYSMGRSRGFDDGRAADPLNPPRSPSAVQTVVLGVLGLGALGAALALQVPGGVRLLTPAKLLEMEEDAGPVHVTGESDGPERLEETASPSER